MAQLIGAEFIYESRQATQLVASGTEQPRPEWALDATLTIQGRDSYHYWQDIVVYGGDIVAISSEVTYPPKLTLADGSTYHPVGFAPWNFYRELPNTLKQPKVVPARNKVLKLPYIAATNDAGGTLVPGDLLMSSSMGKCIEWDTSDATQCVGMYYGRDTTFKGWLKWVMTGWGDYPIKPMYRHVPVTQVTSDGTANSAQAKTSTLATTPASSLKADTTNKIYYTTYTNLSGLYAVDVYSGGSLQTKRYLSGVYGNVYQGTDYEVDLINGTITFYTAQATTATIQANYWYQQGYDRGLQYDAGITGISDGTISGLGGNAPAITDVAGCTGLMYVELFGPMRP